MKMVQVKVFDEEHEDDLSDMINAFLEDNPDIKFSTSCSIQEEEQIYCFSALLIYRT